MSHAMTSPDAGKKLKWARRLGVVGFAFFLAKGLIWLGVLAGGAWYLR